MSDGTRFRVYRAVYSRVDLGRVICQGVYPTIREALVMAEVFEEDIEAVAAETWKAGDSAYWEDVLIVCERDGSEANDGSDG